MRRSFKRASMLLFVLPLFACQDDVRLRQQAAPVTAKSGWRYADNSRFFAYVPRELQEATETNPATLAAAICSSLAGELDFMSSVESTSERIAFNCRLVEPDLAASVSFGELVRKSSGS